MNQEEKKETLKETTKSVLLQEDESWGEFIRTIFYAFIIAISFRTFVIQPFSIPSESMLKNLMVGDFLLVSKASYGFSKHSLPFSLPIIPDKIFADDVQRGDVVVFRCPKDKDVSCIKRVVAVSGDQLSIDGGILKVNGVESNYFIVESEELQPSSFFQGQLY